MLVGSPAYLRSQKKLRSPRDLGSHDLIVFSSLSPTLHWRFFRDGKEEQIRVTPRLLTNSAEAAIAHAERGGGLTLLLGYQVKAQIRAGTLEIVLPKHEPEPLPIQLVYPGAGLPSANLRAFIELAVATRNWNFVEL